MKPSAFEKGFDAPLDLTRAEHDALRHLQALEVHEHEPRVTIFRQNARYGTAYIVKAGWLAEMRILRDGRRQIQNFRLPGEVIGLDGLAYSKSLFAVMSLTRVELVPLPLESFEDLQQRYPRLAAIIFVQTLRTEAVLREWEVNLGRRNGFERLAHLLLELHRRLSLRGLIDDSSTDLPLTQEELADCLGLTSVYVSRLLKCLREEGLAEIAGRRLVIHDWDGLRRSAGFDPRYLEGSA